MPPLHFYHANMKKTDPKYVHRRSNLEEEKKEGYNTILESNVY